MIIKPANKSHRGWTLVEMMVATGVFAIAGLALSTIFIFSIRSFAALENYCTLDRQNRVAMDKLTLEIRQAKQVVGYDTNATSLTILNGDNDQVTYSFNSGLKQMTRAVAGGGTQILLTNCDLIQFSLFQRTPVAHSLDAYSPAPGDWPTTVKVVQLTWKTSCTLPNSQVNSENIQTARVIIRKQKDS